MCVYGWGGDHRKLPPLFLIVASSSSSSTVMASTRSSLLPPNIELLSCLLCNCLSLTQRPRRRFACKDLAWVSRCLGPGECLYSHIHS